MDRVSGNNRGSVLDCEFIEGGVSMLKPIVLALTGRHASRDQVCPVCGTHVRYAKWLGEKSIGKLVRYLFRCRCGQEIQVCFYSTRHELADYDHRTIRKWQRMGRAFARSLDRDTVEPPQLDPEVIT